MQLTTITITITRTTKTLIQRYWTKWTKQLHKKETKTEHKTTCLSKLTKLFSPTVLGLIHKSGP